LISPIRPIASTASSTLLTRDPVTPWSISSGIDPRLEAEGLKVSREIRARKLGDIAPSSTYLVIAGLAGPDYKVEIEGEAVRPE